MSDHDMPRLLMVVPNWDKLEKAYATGRLAAVEGAFRDRVLSDRTMAPDERARAADFQVAYLALAAPAGMGIAPDTLPPMVVCGIAMTGGEDAALTLFANVQQIYGTNASIGLDLRVSAAAAGEIDRFWTHWCPGEAPYGLLGKRAAALRTMRAGPQHLADAGLPGAKDALGRVNLIAIDTGLPPALIQPLGTVRGWEVAMMDGGGITIRKPGDPLTGHGAMVAGNALSLANDIKVLDCPAIPDGIMGLDAFLGWIVAAVLGVKAFVLERQADDALASLPRRSWVVCNAWGVFDPSRETSVLRYSDNPDHPLTAQFRELSQLGVDIVFAAGNCGQFCPNGRCSPDFTGPGRSINGANAMPEALTVGAVRNDRLWLGYSGQGPGIAGLAHDKPDLCAPSQFENDDDAGPNTGTSAACGLASGVVALLRSRWPLGVVDPAGLRAILRDTARHPDGPKGWQERTGHGVLDLAAAAAKLKTLPPPMG